jgi:hypothetical protein
MYSARAGLKLHVCNEVAGWKLLVAVLNMAGPLRARVSEWGAGEIDGNFRWPGVALALGFLGGAGYRWRSGVCARLLLLTLARAVCWQFF